MLNRAYSFIEVKSFDDATRTLTGTATTPTLDRVQDRVNPMGAKFSLPVPFLWQHRHDQPIGHVTDADIKTTGIKFKAEIANSEEPGTLKDRLDEAWQSLKMRLVRATSIGFNPLKWSFIENAGIDYEEWDWLELSAVTIPANPDAVISAVKQFDRIYREAEGIPEFEIPVPIIEPAATGKSSRIVRLDQPARVGAKPFVIREIKRTA